MTQRRAASVPVIPANAAAEEHTGHTGINHGRTAVCRAAQLGHGSVGQTHDLAGPKAFTFTQAAKVMRRATVKAIRTLRLWTQPGHDAKPPLTLEKRWPTSWPTTCTPSRTSAIVTKVTP